MLLYASGHEEASSCPSKDGQEASGVLTFTMQSSRKYRKWPVWRLQSLHSVRL